MAADRMVLCYQTMNKHTQWRWSAGLFPCVSVLPDVRLYLAAGNELCPDKAPILVLCLGAEPPAAQPLEADSENQNVLVLSLAHVNDIRHSKNG